MTGPIILTIFSLKILQSSGKGRTTKTQEIEIKESRNDKCSIPFPQAPAHARPKPPPGLKDGKDSLSFPPSCTDQKKKKKKSQGRPAKPQQCKGVQARQGMPSRGAAMGLCLGGRLGLKQVTRTVMT